MQVLHVGEPGDAGGMPSERKGYNEAQRSSGGADDGYKYSFVNCKLVHETLAADSVWP